MGVRYNVDESGNITAAGSVEAAGSYILPAPAAGARAVISNSVTKKIEESITTATEISYSSGVTSNIQTQLNSKQPAGNYISSLIGDVTAAGPGAAAATIANNAVSNAKLAQMPAFTVKANNTGSTANAQDVLISSLLTNDNFAASLDAVVSADFNIPSPVPIISSFTVIGAGHSVLLPNMTLSTSPKVGDIFIINNFSLSNSSVTIKKNDGSIVLPALPIGASIFLAVSDVSTSAGNFYVFPYTMTYNGGGGQISYSNNGFTFPGKNNFLFNDANNTLSVPNITATNIRSNNTITSTGYFQLSTGVNTTLTNPMPKFIEITNSGAGINLDLPAMNTVDSLLTGPDGSFEIYNGGAATVNVRTSAAAIIASMPTKSYYKFVVTSNATAAGTFIAYRMSLQDGNTATLTTALTGPIATPTYLIFITKINNITYLYFPQISLANALSSQPITCTVALPAQFRPIQTIREVKQGVRNNPSAVVIEVSAAGVITIYGSTTLQGFQNGQPLGLDACCLTIFNTF